MLVRGCDASETAGGCRARTAAHLQEEVAGMNYTDWKSIPEGREKYQAYLCSREWAERRRTVLRRCRNVCERCQANPADTVHHLTYERKYAERSEDLAAWCRRCHDFTHGKSDVDPRAALLGDPQCALHHALCEAKLHRSRDLNHCVCPLPDCASTSTMPLGPVRTRTWLDVPGGYIGGNLIVISMMCGRGHEWDMCFGFWKGYTFAFIRRIERNPP